MSTQKWLAAKKLPQSQNKHFNADRALLYYVSQILFYEEDGPGIGALLHDWGCEENRETLDYLCEKGLLEKHDIRKVTLFEVGRPDRCYEAQTYRFAKKSEALFRG